MQCFLRRMEARRDCTECSAAGVELEVSQSPLSSDAGLLPIREFDRRLGWTAGFAAQLSDSRQASVQALVEMVRQRVFGILAGYRPRLYATGPLHRLTFPQLDPSTLTTLPSASWGKVGPSPAAPPTPPKLQLLPPLLTSCPIRE